MILTRQHESTGKPCRSPEWWVNNLRRGSLWRCAACKAIGPSSFPFDIAEPRQMLTFNVDGRAGKKVAARDVLPNGGGFRLSETVNWVGTNHAIAEASEPRFLDAWRRFDDDRVTDVRAPHQWGGMRKGQFKRVLYRVFRARLSREAKC
jgi:hypothetical protein